MEKLKRLTTGLVLLLALTFGATFSPLAHAAGCQVLSKNILEKKADRYAKTIRSASRKYGVSEDLIKAIITVESCFKKTARGTSGEKGLMQLMPATARRFNVDRGYNPWENVHGGTRYLSYLLKHYDGDATHAVAAYNAGEGNVKRGRRIRNIDYVRKVMRAYNKLAHGKNSRTFARKQSGTQASAGRSKTRSRATVTLRSEPANGQRRSKTRTGSNFHVRDGHTVYEVMRQTGVPVDEIIRLNKLSKPYHLQSGQKLRLR